MNLRDVEWDGVVDRMLLAAELRKDNELADFCDTNPTQVHRWRKYKNPQQKFIDFLHPVILGVMALEKQG